MDTACAWISDALLIEFFRRVIWPELILCADTGGEKPATYKYIDTLPPHFREVGFPEVITVRYKVERAVCHTLEAERLLNAGAKKATRLPISCELLHAEHAG